MVHFVFVFISFKFYGPDIITLNTRQGFPSGLLNEGPSDSLCGVKGSMVIFQGVVFKEVKTTEKY